MLDEDVFFREATLRICGTLRLDRALFDCAAYVRDAIPADRVFMQIEEPELGAMRTIAAASAEAAFAGDHLTPLGDDARKELWDETREGEAGLVEIVTKESPIARDMLNIHGQAGWSVLRMRLLTEDGRKAGLVFLAEGSDRYDDSHVQLLGLLKDPFNIALSNALRHNELADLRDRLVEDNRFLRRELLQTTREIVGADFGLKAVMAQVRLVAPTESPVLLTGETGVGKDVIANAIHRGSERAEGPFVPVNCGAIPNSLIDSELFGHEKGAFTGALDQKRGRFERAHGGTILLDEIGDMPLEAQVRLLRVLQHREIERVGGNEPIPVSIRIIAATNRDLAVLVQNGLFREDLWFRLNVFPIHVPPLRQRKSDLPALVQFFLRKKAGELKVGQAPHLAEGAMDVLLGYHWPGNVRELENVIERAMIIHRGDVLRFDGLVEGTAGSGPLNADSASGSFLLDDVTSDHIRNVLAMTDSKIHGPGGAGELLGINPNTLRYKMKKLGIPFGKGS